MIIECPTCSQSLDVPDEYGGTACTCPTCNQPFAMPMLEPAPVYQEPPSPPRVPSPRRTLSQAGGKTREKPDVERKFSFRLLFVRMMAVLLLIGAVVMFAFAIAIQSTNFDSGFLGGFQTAFLANHGLASWEEMTPPIGGAIIGGMTIPGILVILGTIAVFRRMQAMAIISFALLFLAHLGSGSLPIAPAICIALSSLPGRSQIWKR